ncbi:hypothetical protein [Campylobacter gastrosuis]|uniref:Tetratricopeptide repeat-like domain-containing protein n=1 Tax=Campylobacter gastrosuis TaxID=2974576 RepID=A0ABT7HNP6_9BACT|nr:hypothetical protein [Campylobacter gastrosuis]MDL0088545.1 hypothetical protein [Campylobacter gastrosuis]
MAIKDDLNVIKNELNTQEQFIENIIKGERFFKKYKKPLIATFIIGVVAVAGYFINNAVDESRKEAANVAYSRLILDKNDTQALEILKQKEPSIYALFKFKQYTDNGDINGVKSLLNEPVDPLIKEIFKASIGQSSADIGKEYDTLLRAFLYLKDNKIAEANAEFAKISLNSPLSNLAKNLQHYQGYKK